MEKWESSVEEWLLELEIYSPCSPYDCKARKKRAGFPSSMLTTNNGLMRLAKIFQTCLPPLVLGESVQLGYRNRHLISHSMHICYAAVRIEMVVHIDSPF